MASLNRVILCGNLTDDPELSYTPAGLAVCRLRMAVNERVRSGNEWVDRPCYIDVTAFERQAETCNQYLAKGSPLLLEGRLRYETWEAKDGTRRSKHSVAAERVQFIGAKPQGGGNEPSAPSRHPTAPPPPPPPPFPEESGSGDPEPPF